MLLIAGFSLINCGPTASSPPRVRVSAAASLGPVLTQIQPQLEAELGIHLELNLAGSGTLTRQIIDGAAVDAVLLAHPAWMESLVQTGRAKTTDAVDLFGNTLVVAGRGEAIELADLSAPPRFRRIALGDPASVPAGRYAEQALRAAGVWDDLDGRRITTSDVRAAVAYVQAGEVDAAIVYATDLDPTHESDLTVLHAINPATHDPVVIKAAAIDGSEAGQRVVDWLQTDAAGAGFIEAGFLPLASDH